MKTFKKAAILAMCAVLLVVGTVAGTMAYLTSQTAVVTNTFTVGNVMISLSETEVDANGDAIVNGDRVMQNTYKLIPGKTYDKDPRIHVSAASENCWLFVKVDNGIVDIEPDPEDTNTETIAEQMTSLGWVKIDESNNIYYYNQIVDSNDLTGTNIYVFKTFTVDGAATDATVSSYTNAQVAIQAYAVQSDGFDTAIDAWAAAPLETWTTTP